MRYGGVEGVKRRRLGAESSSAATTILSPVSERASDDKSLRKASDQTPIKEPEVSDGSVFDLDLLDCTICTEPLASPIYQCQNGHVACASCCKFTNNVCPSCQRPTGSIRCLVLEKLIESLKVKCKFADEGCTAMLKFSDKALHQRTCFFEPLSCPFPNCNFSNERYKLLQKHVRNFHSVNWGAYHANTYSIPFCMDPKARSHVLFGTDICFVVHRRQIGTVGMGDMCYLTVLKVLSDRYAMQTSLRYMMKLKTTSDVVGGASSTFTVEADWCIDEPEGTPRDDGFVVVAEGKAVQILDVMFLPPRPPPTTSMLDLQLVEDDEEDIAF